MFATYPNVSARGVGGIDWGLDATDGSTLWVKKRRGKLNFDGNPVFGDGTVFQSRTYEPRDGESAPSAETGLWAIDPATGERKWLLQDGIFASGGDLSERTAPPIAYRNGTLFGFQERLTDAPVAVAYSTDRERLWTLARSVGFREGPNSWAVGDDRLYLSGVSAERDDRIVVLSVATATGEVRWRKEVTFRSLISAIDGDVLYLVGDGLVALDRYSGNVRWRLTPDDSGRVPGFGEGLIAGIAGIGGDTVVGGGRLYARAAIDNKAEGPIAIEGGGLIVSGPSREAIPEMDLTTTVRVTNTREEEAVSDLDYEAAVEFPDDAPATDAGGGTAAQDGASLTLDASGGATGDDRRVNVSMTLRNDGAGESVAPVVDVQPPTNWTVTARYSSNGTWRNASNEWLLLSLDAGASGRATVTLLAPRNASGTASVELAASGARNATASTAATVRAGAVEDDEGTSDDGDGAGPRPSARGVPLWPAVAGIVVLVPICYFLIRRVRTG